MVTTQHGSAFLALHGLAVKKAGGVEDVAPLAGLTAEEVEQALESGAQAGHVLGARGKFMLTPAGRAWLDEQYSVHFATHRADPALGAAYDRFEVINRELLALMTRWQTVTVGGQTVPNDHTDARYDEAVVDELGSFHERAVPVLRTFAELEPRLEVHIDALERAQARIIAGEYDYVSGARIPSYHTVWFEMHEDLLRILGRKREE